MSFTLPEVTLQVYLACAARSTSRKLLAVSRQRLANGRRIWSGQIHAAVDVEDVAGDVGGFVAGEENDGGGDILAGAHAAERNAHFQFFFYFVGKDGCHGRLDETRSHGVDRDVARSDFDGDGFGEADEAGFGRDVIGLAGVAAFGDDGRDVDDAAGAGFHHRREHLLNADVCTSEIG